MSNTEVMKQSAVKLAGKHPKNKIHRTAGDIGAEGVDRHHYIR